MSEKRYFSLLRAEFFTFFVWYPLMTLILIPIFFVLYGGDFDQFWSVIEKLFTWSNVIKYFALLVISFIGHVTYGWLKQNAAEQSGTKE
jgi:hypothetical protein